MGAPSKLQSPPSSNEYFMENTMRVAIIGIELNQPKTNPLRHGSTSLKLLRKSSTGPDADHGTTSSTSLPSNNDASTYANMYLCKLDFQITLENVIVLIFVLAHHKTVSLTALQGHSSGPCHLRIKLPGVVDFGLLLKECRYCRYTLCEVFRGNYLAIFAPIPPSAWFRIR